MKIIGFNLTKISVNRKEKLEGKLEINQNIDIKDVVKDSIPITEEVVLKIDFYFQINYSKDLAKLDFEGNVLIIPEKEELKDILKSWKDKKIPDETRVPLFNFIMSKCNIKALMLEDEMNLPYHIPMPRMNLPEPDNNKN
jgi:hypothetical protein